MISGTIFLCLLICGGILAFTLKKRMRLYLLACGMFIVGVVATGAGVLAGLRDNHWEARYRKGGDSWYQEIGLGLILIAGSIYLARRDWPKKEPNQSSQPMPLKRHG